MWIHGEPGAAHVFSGEEHALPMLAAIDGAKYSAFLLRTGNPAEGAGKGDVWIRGMKDDAADSPGFLQPHVGPGLASVGGLINSVAHYVAVADDPGFTGSRPDHTWIGRGNGERSDERRVGMDRRNRHG